MFNSFGFEDMQQDQNRRRAVLNSQTSEPCACVYIDKTFDTSERQFFNHIRDIVEVKHEVLQPQGATLADSGQLGWLVVGETEGGLRSLGHSGVSKETDDL